MKVEIENLSDGPINIDLGPNESIMSAFSLHEIRPDGTSHTSSPRAPSNGAVFLMEKTIQARRTDTADLVLQPWLGFDQLGVYQVDIRFLGRAWDGVGKGIRPLSDRQEPLVEVNVDAPSTSQHVEITPRDEAVLRERCKDWMRAVNDRQPSYEASRRLAPLLQLIDPVAVSYLRDAVERFHVYDAFGTLVRIGTPEAREAVIQIARSKDRELAQMAKSVLLLFPSTRSRSSFRSSRTCSTRRREP